MLQVVEIGDKGLFSNNYTYAVVVNGEQRSAAWVLSRSPTMSDRQFKGIKARLKEMGVPTEKLTLTKQQVSDYWQLNQ
jgi:lipocalin